MFARKSVHAVLMGGTLAGFLAALPVGVHLGRDGVLALKASVAFAKDGRDDDGNDDRGGDGDDDRGDDRDDDRGDDRDDDRGDDGDDDRGRDRDDDDRGRGGNDDRDDDRGRGRGGDDDDRGGRRGGEEDDGRGRGRGRDDVGADDRGGRDGNTGGIEVTIEGGGRVEIENGRFERKDARGRTIEERPATAADLARYSTGERVAARGNRRGGGVVAKVEREGNNLEVVYVDGWKEEIEAGRYELKDNLNRTVVERPATQADLRRLLTAFR